MIEILVDDLGLVVGLHVRAGHHAPFVPLDPQGAGAGRGHLHDQRFEVEADIGDVFHDAGDRAELVLDPLNAGLRDRASFQAGKQNAAQAIADRCAKAPLERLGDEPPVSRGRRFPFMDHPAGKLQATPTNTHSRSPCFTGMTGSEARIRITKETEVRSRQKPAAAPDTFLPLVIRSFALLSSFGFRASPIMPAANRRTRPARRDSLMLCPTPGVAWEAGSRCGATE